MFHVKRFFFVSLILPFFSFCQQVGTTTLEVKGLPTVPSQVKAINNFIDSFPFSKQLSGIQKEWFYWTNYSRSNPRRFWDSVVLPLLTTYPALNNSNAKSLRADLFEVVSLPLLLPDSSLTMTAITQAKDLSKSKNHISHTSSKGESFQQRMQNATIKTCAGENISMGANNPLLMLVLLYLDDGVKSLGHRKALLNPAFIEMGIGTATYSSDIAVVVQDFACKQ